MLKNKLNDVDKNIKDVKSDLEKLLNMLKDSSKKE
jgi:hypothetical protein